MNQTNILKNVLWLLNNLKSLLMAATLCCCHFFIYAQNRNSVWCFGDSALIDFNDTSNVIVGFSGLDTRGSCVSISNLMGQLLFSAETRAGLAGNTALVFDSSHQLMQNGDSIIGRGWYHELVIIPNPANDSTYYLFSIGVTTIYGLYYSIIDMRLNNGKGAVTAKNIQLQNFANTDCLNAIKHGNGRDWWLMFRKSGVSPGSPNNDFYQFLITPQGINNLTVQSIGTTNRTNLGIICFSPSGSKIAFTNIVGLIEVFDFDRCSGLISNPILIQLDTNLSTIPYTWSCAFSPDETRLYVSTCDTTTYLYQYDLNASNVAASKDTLWSISSPKYAGGALKLAPDNKIYMSSWYDNQLMFPYPYPDSVYNVFNMNLSVINSPDSLGVACDFQPYSFYLGGKRTYLGLPNNPDYELPALAGSLCDTLTSVSNNQAQILNPQLFVSYISDWQKLFINAQNLKGKNITLTIYDATGKLIYTKDRSFTQSGYYTLNINCANFATGMYIINLVTEKEKISKRISVVK